MSEGQAGKPFLKKAERLACHKARDAFWDCMATKADQADQCEEIRKTYQSLCPAQWRKHFDERRKFLMLQKSIEDGTFKGKMKDMK